VFIACVSCTSTFGSDVLVVELGQYTSISIYRNTDIHNIISIHPITVSIYRNIDISQFIVY